MIITAGAAVGRALEVRDHPNGRWIWLAQVDLGEERPVQIVFGGQYRVEPGELVPVAPPGAQVIVLPRGLEAVPRMKKMRSRRYRGERSHGMLCSLAELGWLLYGPDEVAILHGLEPGDSLDDLPVDQRRKVVPGWQRALEWAGGDNVDEVVGWSVPTGNLCPPGELMDAAGSL